MVAIGPVTVKGTWPRPGEEPAETKRRIHVSTLDFCGQPTLGSTVRAPLGAFLVIAGRERSVELLDDLEPAQR